MNDFINREASDKTKGFRLQKLRAVGLMLDLLETKKASLFYAAIEHFEDVSLKSASRHSSETYFEEDKDYDPSTGFSLNSEEVKNTLVSFFDIYVFNWQFSRTINLGFHSTNRISKENRTNSLRDAGVDLPDKPIIQLLAERDYAYPNLLTAVRFILLSEYEKQYANHRSNGNLENLKKITNEELVSFLDTISWSFGNGDHEKEQELLLEKIRNSSLFNYRLEGKENIISALLVDKLDERQSLANLNDRFLYDSDLKYVFKEAEGEALDQVFDPAWERWVAIGSSDDTRNLKDKVRSVYPECSDKIIRSLSLKSATSKLEEERFTRNFRSLKYRVYESCLTYFERTEVPENFCCNEELFEHLDAMYDRSFAKIESLKQDFHYKISSESIVHGAVLQLFDECFLAFDEPGKSDE